MLQERVCPTSDHAHDGGQVATPQSAVNGQQYAAGTLSDGSDHVPDITNLEGPNEHLSTNPKKHRRISEYDE
ncbi:hypothetical protein L873DRAFT_1811962 [Choiromyces venosus 120613-1]|uniref:Uncharacterized protein n=1 Tax=Choiromyces venosus 120613-1 TaxID=1336337 RepID=A0A3N4JFM8_9PEZI|nr:hypothetical protein L873DRAFT_1811962 [Choiromyces venosus 120613-1]